jgi:hypothetical protein
VGSVRLFVLELSFVGGVVRVEVSFVVNGNALVAGGGSVTAPCVHLSIHSWSVLSDHIDTRGYPYPPIRLQNVCRRGCKSRADT